jgi:hypothetical protein
MRMKSREFMDTDVYAEDEKIGKSRDSKWNRKSGK